MFDRPRLGLVNTPPNTVSPQPGLDNGPLVVAEVETPRDITSADAHTLPGEYKLGRGYVMGHIEQAGGISRINGPD